MNDSRMERYRLVPQYLIRMSAAPFDALSRLATAATSAQARRVTSCEDALAAAGQAALAEFRQKKTSLPEPAASRARNALGRGLALDAAVVASSPALGAYDACFRTLTEARVELERLLAEELDGARKQLFESARTLLPRYAPFAGTSGMRDFLRTIPSGADGAAGRNARARQHERHLLLYVQRFCAKNETFSEFGPGGWGSIEPGLAGMRLEPVPGIARREAFLERWAVDAVIEVMNADPDVRPQVPPRLHPFGHLEGESFIREDTGAERRLNGQEREVLSRCDGRTPAHQVGALDVLQLLAQDGVLLWEVEPLAMAANALEGLLADVRGWQDGKARRSWLNPLEELAAIPAAFAAEADVERRVELMDSARSWLEAMGTSRKEGQRLLYDATNPIFEECHRECRMVIGEEVAATLEQEAAPWFELWRDTYAYVASRVAGRIRGMLETAPRRGGRVSLPAFLRHCAAEGTSLMHTGLVDLAREGFADVTAAFRELAASWPDAPERQLTAEDCGFLRRRLTFNRFEEFTWPSADLQLSASSAEAVGRGEYDWVVAELHSPFAILQHAAYWACPDPERLSADLRLMAGRPACYFGFASGISGHIALHLHEPLREGFTFAAHGRGRPEWAMVAPADAEVHADEATGDVRIRSSRTGAELGSFARFWALSAGFHPFLLTRAPHTPRLRLGRVIVQRRCWVVKHEELVQGAYRGVSAALVAAVERLRAARELPRWIFIRPTDEALPRMGAKGRDKDVKPIFVDLESYLSLEVFHHWLSEYGELEITEMLPDPEHLPWKEPEGRRCFELRTLLAPG